VKRIILVLSLIAGAASAQFSGTPAWQSRVKASSWTNIAAQAGGNTNVQDVLNWIDANWPRFDSSAWGVIAPTSDTLQVFGDWMDANFPNQAARIFFSNANMTVISGGAGTNLQAALSSIDTNLALRYPASNPSNYVTDALVFAQPTAVAFRQVHVYTQRFVNGASWAGVTVATSDTASASSFISTSNGMVHAHSTADTFTVPTGGWYFVTATAAGFLYGPNDAGAASFDTWVSQNGNRDVLGGSRTMTQVYQTTNEISPLVNYRWFKQSGSALLRLASGDDVALEGLCAGNGATADVVYASIELRRVGP
jgi:hypothetical protein